LIDAVIITPCMQGTGSLREELGSIAPELAEMRRRRDERRREILDVAERVNRVRQEIGGQPHDRVAVDGSDLTLARLEELRAQLHRLQTEREDRARRATELRALLRSSSLVLGMDPRRDDLCGGDISDGAIATLAAEIERLRGIKRDRMHKVETRLLSSVFTN
jgi:Ase1/PRC1/MAP65 family protein